MIGLACLLAAGSAWGYCVAFYKGEVTEGLNKICYYDHLGSTLAINKKSYETCPVTIRVEC